MAASETLRLAVHRAAAELDSDGALAECASAFAAADLGPAARLLWIVRALRGGADARCGDAAVPDGGRLAPMDGAALRRAIADLAALSGMNGGDAAPSALGVEDGASPLLTAAAALLQALCRAGGPQTFAEIAEAFARLEALVAEDAGALPDEASAAESGRWLAARALRAYVADAGPLATGPYGGPGVLHALFRAAPSGVGSWGRRTADLVRSGRELLALVQLALGRPLTALSDRELSAAVLALTCKAPTRLRCETVDALGDLGLLAPLRALTEQTRRASWRPLDRELLQHLRDAGLDLQDLDIGWTAQRLLARGWSDDRNEWQALGDVAAYRGDYAEAERCYERALQLDAGSGHARNCLQRLRQGDTSGFHNAGGFGSDEGRRRQRRERLATPASPPLLPQETRALRFQRDDFSVVPELLPSTSPSIGWIPDDGLHLRQMGARRRRGPWGELPVLQGVTAVRGFYVSGHCAEAVAVRVGGRLLARSVPVFNDLPDGSGRSKQTFNLWIDLSGFAPGRYELEIQVERGAEPDHHHREQVLVDAPVSEAQAPTSDAVVDAPSDASQTLEAAIAARPSAVRAAGRSFFQTPPSNILVLRVDQLGDMVCSVPALQRLRQLLPDARLTGLVTPANAGLARTLDLFDDLIVVDFADDPTERRRVMPAERQLELEAALKAREFDLAVDLADNSPSRYLMLLSGAKRLLGVQGDGYGFLDLNFQSRARDLYNGGDSAPASNKMLAMIEWLGAQMADLGRTLRRDDLRPAALSAFGVRERRYVVLHTGARIPFSRWPDYPKLARLLLEQTGCEVVLIHAEPLTAVKLGPGLVGHPRFRLIDRPLAFDELDLLLSYCAVFVGNDSGPKHLASLRGSEVVSLHCARNNWNEWGQENRGLIISRRLPCAGCQIRDYPDECGKDFVCVTGIRPQEVLAAVLDRLSAVEAASNAQGGDDLRALTSPG